jgi:hypothetical protein
MREPAAPERVPRCGRCCVSSLAATMPKVYVKVDAKLAEGSVKFHKDGYTDLRGRFDYASVNTPERRAIERFAALVLSDDKGVLIREAAPPQQWPNVDTIPPRERGLVSTRDTDPNRALICRGRNSRACAGPVGGTTLSA